MEDAKRAGLESLIERLQLAVADMEQVRAAVLASRDTNEPQLLGALETAIVVCYMRPFTGRYSLPRKYRPKCELHNQLKEARGNLYAHMDHLPGRRAYVVSRDPEAGLYVFGMESQTRGLPSVTWEPALQLAECLRRRFNADSIELAQKLNNANPEAFGD